MERHRIFRRVHLVTLAAAGAVLVAGAVLGVSASSSTSADAAAVLGQAPPMNSQTVSQLKVKWTSHLKMGKAYVYRAQVRADRVLTPAATTDQVQGKEFNFRLSSRSIAKPGTVTFNFKNTGHVLHAAAGMKGVFTVR